MSGQYDNCTSITPECPVEGTIYGYYPSLGANIFFAAFFGIALAIQFVQGIRWKTWSFLVAVTIGCLAECIGYAGRIMLHYNPWSSNGFEIQICCLIIAPAFFSAGVYLTLKHLVRTFGAEFSRVKPRWITWTFIMADLFALILQGAGGGIAATANTQNMQNVGNSLMMAGIVWQVVTLLLFGTLSADYFLRVWGRRSELAPATYKIRHDRKFHLYLTAIFLAYITIMTRCIYRIGEMANGWSNSIMQNQPTFIGLDGCMITIAVICLTVFHPGYCFKPMYERTVEPAFQEKENDMEGSPARS